MIIQFNSNNDNLVYFQVNVMFQGNLLNTMNVFPTPANPKAGTVSIERWGLPEGYELDVKEWLLVDGNLTSIPTTYKS